MLKNQIVKVNIESVGINGEGVGRVDNMVVFVKGALPGECVRAKIISAKKSYCYAIMDGNDAIIGDKSPFRVSPPCPVFGKCGGCSIMHVDYQNQLKIKQDYVRDTLKKVGGIEVAVLPVEPSKRVLGYRNKMSLPIRRENGVDKIGLFALSSHRVVQTDDCLLQPEWNKTIISLVKQFMTGQKISGYDESDASGIIRHIVVREVEKRLFITVVATKKIKLDKLSAMLKESFSNFSLWLNVNDRKDNVILGEQWYKIGGEDDKSEIEGFIAKIHPAGFFQVNDYICDKIYTDVAKRVQALAPDCVIDAYSGAGIMTAMLSKHCKSVIGIEVNRQASDSAQMLIKDNKIENMSAICGRVEDNIGDVAGRCEGKSVTVVLDPPRIGCDKAVLEAIIEAKIKDVIYVSCAPNTLSRDLGVLKEHYDVVSVKPYDMFAMTMNVETVAILTRKNQI